MYYNLFSLSTYPNSQRAFADGLDLEEYTDNPYFRGISRGLGKSGELQLIVDINGAFHLSYSFSLNHKISGPIYGVGYVEGYICTWVRSGCLGNTPSPSEVTSAIDGLCQSNDLVLMGGINSAPICSGLHPLTAGSTLP